MRRKYLSISKLSIVALSVAAALVSLNVRWKQNFFHEINAEFRQRKGIV